MIVLIIRGVIHFYHMKLRGVANLFHIDLRGAFFGKSSYATLAVINTERSLILVIFSLHT